MANADDIINEALNNLDNSNKQEIATVDAPPPTPTPKEKGDDEIITVQTLAQMASDALGEQVRSGAKDLSEATVDIVKSTATAKAAIENADKYAEIAGGALTHEIKADKERAHAGRIDAGNKSNEAFYERFRPILEFDFGNITGNPKQKTVGTESKSYSKLFMVFTIIIAAIPWLAVALILYVFKGINAIVELVKQFTKIAQAVIWTGVGLTLAYILFRVIAYYIEFYTGVRILPF